MLKMEHFMLFQLKSFNNESRLFTISTVIMPKERSLEIDSLEDFNKIQNYLIKFQKKNEFKNYFEFRILILTKISFNQLKKKIYFLTKSFKNSNR